MLAELFINLQFIFARKKPTAEAVGFYVWFQNCFRRSNVTELYPKV